MYSIDVPYIPLTEPMKGAESAFMQLFRSRMKPKHRFEEAAWNTGSKNYLGRPGRRFCLNLPCVFSMKALKHMESNLLRPNNLTWRKLIEISPYEFEWYCDYVLKENPIDYVVSTPFFVSFYNNTFYQIYRYLGFTEKILAEHYAGLIMHEGYIDDLKFRPSIIGDVARYIITRHYRKHKEKR
jgi:hypothetical protein